MNKEQAIKLFEGLIEDAEKAKKSWGLGDTGYYTSEALISAYNLAISVLKVMDVEEQPKRWVVKDSKGECVYELRLAYTNSTMINTDKRGIDPLTFTDIKKAEAVALLVDGSVEEI